MARHTRGAIIDSFWTLLREKSLDKITVRDVIELAEINRNTFYYHFEDLYALLDTVFREEAEHYRSNIDENGTFYEEYIRAASVFMNNRNAIIHVYNSKGKDVLNKYMKAASDDFVSRFVRQKAQPFNENLLQPCPMLENPQILRGLVDETGAHSTDMMSPEACDHLCAKCDNYAKEWKPVADKLWSSNHPDYQKE